MKNHSEDSFPFRYLIIFFVIAGIITSVGYLFYLNQKKEIENELYKHVVSIKEIKLQQISKEQQQRKKVINSFLQLPQIQNDLNNILSDKDGQSTSKEISNWANELEHDFDFVSVNIFNRNAELVYSTDSTKEILNIFLKHEFKILLQRDSSFLTNLYLGKNKNLLQAIITPVKKSGNIIGYIWTEISFFEYLHPILSYTKRETEFVDYILLKNNSDLGFILKDVKRNNDYVLNILPLNKKDKSEYEKLITKNNLKEKSTIKNFIASVNIIPGTDWYLLAKIDQEKVSESIRTAALIIFTITLLLVIFAASLTYSLWGRSKLHFLKRTMNLRKEKDDLNERYTSLTRYANDMIFSFDTSGKILEANQKAFDVYGYDKGELLRLNFLDLSYDKKKDLQILFSSIITEAGILFETNHHRKNGTIIPVEISAKLIKQGEDEIILAIVRDNTERKKLELDLILAKDKAEEMDRLKTIFLSNMSHELNTPMSGIMGFSELLLSELESDSHKKMAQYIYKSSKRLNDTLTSLLDISKLESQNVEARLYAVDITTVLEECKRKFTDLALNKGLIINSSYEEEKTYIKADTSILYKIFSSLLDNAIKYTLRGSINLDVYRKGDKIYIKFKDTGIGIPEDKLEVIFEPFRQGSEGLTRKYEGSGLGLTITKKFVEILNGKLSIKSLPEIGTEIILEFSAIKD